MSELRVHLPSGVQAAEALLALSSWLYQSGRLSLGQAAEMAGCSKREYIDALGVLKVPIIDYPAEDLESEMQSDA